MVSPMTAAENLVRTARDFLEYVKYCAYIEDRDEARRTLELAYALEKALKAVDEQP